MVGRMARTEPKPGGRNSLSKPPLPSSVEHDDGNEGRSCMTLFPGRNAKLTKERSFRKGRRLRAGRLTPGGNSSSATAASDEKGLLFGEPASKAKNHKRQQQTKIPDHNVTREDAMMMDMIMVQSPTATTNTTTSSASTQVPSSFGASSQSSSSRENSPNPPSVKNINNKHNHLLTPPSPSDRSIKSRLAKEHEHRTNMMRRGLYDGEMEPEGVRGQEARVVAPKSSSNTTRGRQQGPQHGEMGAEGVNFRSFDGQQGPVQQRQGPAVIQVVSSPVEQHQQQHQRRMLSPFDDEDDEDDYDEDEEEEKRNYFVGGPARSRLLLHRNMSQSSIDSIDDPATSSSPSSAPFSSNGRRRRPGTKSRLGVVQEQEQGVATSATPAPVPAAQPAAPLQFSASTGRAVRWSPSIDDQQDRERQVDDDEHDYDEADGGGSGRNRNSNPQQQQQPNHGHRTTPSSLPPRSPPRSALPPRTALRNHPRQVRPPHTQNQNYPTQSNSNGSSPARSYSEAESTASDDDIRYMLPDLLPSMDAASGEEKEEDVHPEETYGSAGRQPRNEAAPLAPLPPRPPKVQNQPRGAISRGPVRAPSPVAQQAAAAAAATLEERHHIANGTNVIRNHHSPKGDEAQQQEHEERDEEEHVQNLNAMAMKCVQSGDYDRALEAFSEVLAIHRDRHGKIHPAVASAYHNLGTVHAKRASSSSSSHAGGNHSATNGSSRDSHDQPSTTDSPYQRECRAQALSCFQAAARSARDSLGPNHPNVAVSLVRIGFLLLQSRQYLPAIITFTEAARVRTAHYGPEHRLVANLYNNLGVCHMHLQQFVEGRAYLENALQIQRGVVAKKQQEAAHRLLREQVAMQEQQQAGTPTGNTTTNKNMNKNNSRSENDEQIRSLELADTLFNIGGLCLEWIRRKGPDGRRAIDAEHAFQEAMEIRARILGREDPMVSQVKSLLDMARAVPRPVATNSNKRSIGRSRSRSTSPARAFQEKPRDIYRRQRDAPGIVKITNHHTGSLRSVYSASSIDRSATRDGGTLSPSASGGGRGCGDGEDSIFRARETPVNSVAAATTTSTSKSTPRQLQTSRSNDPSFPVMEISVSYDEGDADQRMTFEGTYPSSPRTRVLISPHLVPEHSPHRSTSSPSSPMNHNSYGTKNTGTMLDRDDYGARKNRKVPALSTNRSHSYDAEESCLINDAGIESGRGRVHLPFSWSESSTANVQGRDLVVTQPIRAVPNATATNTPKVDPKLARSASSSDLWGSETVNFTATGNTERDSVMARARAILNAHNTGTTKSAGATPLPTKSDNTSPAAGEEGVNTSSNSDMLRELLGSADFEEETPIEEGASKSGIYDHDLLEDGVAPLGGDWSKDRAPSTKMMLKEPMMYLHQVHEDASKRLKTNNFVEAVRLFELVLECQKRRQGSRHPDVAAASHNVGIAQLRSQNPEEALRAFTEAVNVRKETLGKSHPQVAVSLAKVGISYLLLHRFDEALSNFREALEVRKHALGSLHPSTARIYNNIGCVHVELDESGLARRAFESALDIQRNALCHEPDSGPLMFATATTLCNLGYLYRYRDMYSKAAVVMKEAYELQERVLGESHPTVLSTMDTLADSCAGSGQSLEAIKYYSMVLDRFRAGETASSKSILRAGAVLLYKMSRIHRERNDAEAQLGALRLALRSVRAYLSKKGGPKADPLERRIQYDIRACREQMEKDELQLL